MEELWLENWFNRTFMELKFVRTNDAEPQLQRFNRTFMELKSLIEQFSRVIEQWFNRTFMELK